MGMAAAQQSVEAHLRLGDANFYADLGEQQHSEKNSLLLGEGANIPAIMALWRVRARIFLGEHMPIRTLVEYLDYYPLECLAVLGAFTLFFAIWCACCCCMRKKASSRRKEAQATCIHDVRIGDSCPSCDSIVPRDGDGCSEAE